MSIILKVIISLVSLLLVFVIIAFIYFSISSRSGLAPGLIKNRLAPCPGTPNCVTSEYPDDESHFVSGFVIGKGQKQKAWSVLVQVIEDGGGIIVDNNVDDYLAATFTSTLFGFVDDLEARLDPEQGMIHIRSASRVGKSDFGVNNKRIEAIRMAFNSTIDK